MNKLILQFVENVKEDNYDNIIKYLQDNDIDSNNELIDKLLLETNKQKHELLLKKLKNTNNIDYKSSGYACKLFKILIIKKEFCFIEKKEIIVYYVKKHMKK